MARAVPLLLVILLIALADAKKTKTGLGIRDADLPPAARKRVMAIRAELRILLTEACKRLIYVMNEIKWARRCVFNGLKVSDYLAYKAICKNRSETLDALREYRMKCRGYPAFCDEHKFKKLLEMRQRAVAACEKIGWDGSGKDCPNLRALEAEFERLKGSCNGKVDKIRELRKKIRDVKANFVKPSVAPVARFEL